ncbi:MAG: endonuclease VIII [candidate division WOR-3 bacterium]|nr:endonuclease VIII [candidate division WOR-3 bacterium]
MFELPECVTLTRQMSETLRGKTVQRGRLGNSPHKFVWYNRKPAEFERLTRSKTVGTATARGRWMFVPLEPGYVMVFGECGGRLLYHEPGAGLPAKYHLLLELSDGSALSVTTQMWGAMELFEQGREQERKYIKGMRPTPVDKEFTLGYFSRLVDELTKGEKRSVKGLLTQEQLVPGLGNSIAQDIMFRAGLHPRHAIAELPQAQRRGLHSAIVKTVRDVLSKGGRSDELDLFGEPGGYERILSGRTAGKPCPVCGTKIEKAAYLGGACYFCPKCQE